MHRYSQPLPGAGGYSTIQEDRAWSDTRPRLTNLSPVLTHHPHISAINGHAYGCSC